MKGHNEIVRVLKEAGGREPLLPTDRLRYLMGIHPGWSDKFKLTSTKESD